MGELTPLAVLLPAGFAGLVAIGATVAIERLGGRIGGLLATLPTTIVPASIGIAVAAPTVDETRAALYAVPGAMLINVGFLWLWRALPPRLPAWSLRGRLAAMTAGSLACWFVGAWALVHALAFVSTRGPRALEAAGWGGTAAMVVFGVLACRSTPPAPRGTPRVGVPPGQPLVAPQQRERAREVRARRWDEEGAIAHRPNRLVVAAYPSSASASAAASKAGHIRSENHSRASAICHSRKPAERCGSPPVRSTRSTGGRPPVQSAAEKAAAEPPLPPSASAAARISSRPS